MKYLNVAVIGNVLFTRECIECILKIAGVKITLVVTRPRKYSSLNSDFCDLKNVCRKYSLRMIKTRDASSDVAIQALKEADPDLILVLGYSHILKKTVFNIPRIGVIGFHPAILPDNRGRHPLVWALANGLEESGITFFFIDDESVDSGDVVYQKKFKISKKDTAFTLYKRMTSLAKEGLVSILNSAMTGKIDRARQNDNKANYWRKRRPEDGIIDWRMSTERIYNLIRALTTPYAGAHCNYKGTAVKVWGAKPSRLKAKRCIEPGKILHVEKDEVHIKTGDGVIALTRHEFKRLPSEGDYII